MQWAWRMLLNGEELIGGGQRMSPFFSLSVSFLEERSVQLCTQKSSRNAYELTSPNRIPLADAAEHLGEGAPSGHQVAAAESPGRARSNTHLLQAPHSRLMGPRREG